MRLGPSCRWFALLLVADDRDGRGVFTSGKTWMMSRVDVGREMLRRS